MAGVTTHLEALKRQTDTNQVTFTTVELSGNESHEFKLDGSEPEIENIQFKPGNVGPAQEGVLLMVRPVVKSGGSTNTTFSIHEDPDRDDIDEVVRLENLNEADLAQTFQPGAGQGVQFENQLGEEEWYITLNELSGVDSVYTIRLRWLDVKQIA